MLMHAPLADVLAFVIARDEVRSIPSSPDASTIPPAPISGVADTEPVPTVSTYRVPEHF